MQRNHTFLIRGKLSLYTYVSALGAFEHQLTSNLHHFKYQIILLFFYQSFANFKISRDFKGTRKRAHTYHHRATINTFGRIFTFSDTKYTLWSMSQFLPWWLLSDNYNAMLMMIFISTFTFTQNWPVRHCDLLVLSKELLHGNSVLHLQNGKRTVKGSSKNHPLFLS